MDSPEASLKLAIVVVLSAVFGAIFIQRRYGPVWPKILARLGPRWPRIIKIGSIATLALWVLFWILVSPEQRADLRRFFEESAPWVVR